MAYIFTQSLPWEDDPQQLLAMTGGTGRRYTPPPPPPAPARSKRVADAWANNPWITGGGFTQDDLVPEPPPPPPAPAAPKPEPFESGYVGSKALTTPAQPVTPPTPPRSVKLQVSQSGMTRPGGDAGADTGTQDLPARAKDYLSEYIEEARRNMLAEPKQAFTPEQMEQRQWENDRDYQMGLLASVMGSSALQKTGGDIFKQALKARQPVVTDKGLYDPQTGQWTLNPESQRDVYRTAYEKALQLQATKQIEMAKAAAELQQKDIDSLRHNQTLQLIARMNQGAKEQPNLNYVGYDARTGQEVVEDAKSARRATVSVDAKTGRQTFTPFQGDLIPNQSAEQALRGNEGVMTYLNAADRIDSLVNATKMNPGAVGITGWALSKAQGKPGSQLTVPIIAAMANLTPDQLTTRARLAQQAAEITQQVYGANVSTHEEAKAKGWLVDVANDGVDQILAKLEAARQHAQEKASQYGPGMLAVANRRRGVTQAPGGPATGAAGGGQGGSSQTGGLTPQEAQELEALRAHFGRQ